MVEEETVEPSNIGQAVRGILRRYLDNGADNRGYRRGENVVCFDGWNGIGASAVLAALVELPKSKEFNFDKVIHIDCSTWQSRRSMQRRIAEELKLDKSVMAIFDKHDEDDDFSGVEKSSRTEVADVSGHIFRALKDSRFLVIFHNGSDAEIDLTRFGIPASDWTDNKLVWTFRGRFRIEPTFSFKDLKNTHVVLRAWPRDGGLSERDVTTLVHEEAAELCHCIGRHDITPATATDCWLYMVYGKFSGYDQDGHASNYWVCDGIIGGEGAWEASSRLCEAMRSEHLPTEENKRMWFDQFSNHRGNKSRWISITSKDVEKQNIQTIPQETTSYFLALQKPMALPKDLFPQSSKLGVLKLSCCTFSFASPPFLCCHNLRFLWIDSCEDIELTDGSVEKHEEKWTCLQSLWVLDIRYTNWPWILSPQMMELMIELRELNVKSAGVNRWTWCITTPKLKLLHNLVRFRVIESSTYLKAIAQELLVEMEKLELLDLSGNSAMEVLPNLSGASRLKVLILDGCAGLKHVEPDVLPTSLESFSFDGFGPASGWKHSLDMPEKKMRPSARTSQESPRVSKISLHGCAQLKSVFFRGLPNLMELNLSNTAIEELGLDVMQTHQLELLFMLGCENLHWLKWRDPRNPPLKLLRIDTRVKTKRALDDDCQGSCSYHIVVADARFLRGFCFNVDDGKVYSVLCNPNIRFHLHLSHTINHTQVKGTNKQKEISLSDKLSISQAIGSSFPYTDVPVKVVDKDGEDGCSVQACVQHEPLQSHIEISEGGCNWESIQDRRNMDLLMLTAESLHVHDHSSITIANVGTDILRGQFENMRWCRVDRCPKLHAVFLLDEHPMTVESFMSIQTLWASHLPAVECIWSRKIRFYEDTTRPVRAFQKLRYIHLHSCPRLTFILPWSFPTMASLETIHITYCGELTEIFPKGEPYKGKSANHIEFPRLRHIHLHDLPMLQHICETDMLAPALETIKLRGCWSLRRLPAIHSGRRGDKLPAVVDCEKDWWNKLEWDGLEASRHLFRPRHSRYYKKTMPRGSLLR